MSSKQRQQILVLDYGSPYTQLIARRVRDIGVYCEVRVFDLTKEEFLAFNPAGVIISDAGETPLSVVAPALPDFIIEAQIPVLGIGYGMQMLARDLGGAVLATDPMEDVMARIQVVAAEDPLLGELSDDEDANEAVIDVWLKQQGKVVQVPAGFEITAEAEHWPVLGMSDTERNLYGVYFHPELNKTPQGTRILERFVVDVCGCEKTWTPKAIIEQAVKDIRAQVGTDEVILGLSGGVDSSVVAALLHKAIGDQLTCVFVDHGLLRLNEGKQVMEMFAENMGVNVVKVDAEDIFLSRLAGVSDPEEKRKIIGNTFIELFDEQAAAFNNAKWLAQGTIYPDVIESVASKQGGAAVKSHHNVGGLPEDMKLKLVEPLRQLFKDEVRKIGLELGLPYDMVYRHPFPGPGLGVRILGEVKKEYADLLRQADHIFITELLEEGLYHKTSQAFTVFIPVKSVGVVEGKRRYEYVVSLRAVETVDFMTARWAHLPYDFLERVSRRIIEEIPGISRVAYDISSKPPATIEWE